jgi:hypothetical protein
MLRYSRTGLLPDLLFLCSAFVPLVPCSGFSETTRITIDAFQLLSLGKWVKLGISEQWQALHSLLSSLLGAQAYRVLGMVHKASLLVHWFACLFHYVAVTAGETDTWLDVEAWPLSLPLKPHILSLCVPSPTATGQMRIRTC